MTNALYKNSTQVYLTEIQAYQIWRDRDCIALIDCNNSSLVLFGCMKPQPQLIFEVEDITKQNLWKNIKQHHKFLWLAAPPTEIERAWQFLRPLDPKILELYQIKEQKKYWVQTA